MKLSRMLASLGVAALALPTAAGVASAQPLDQLGIDVAAASALAADGVIEPTDPRLIPNPIENSDPGTSFACQSTGTEIKCVGDLRYTWASEPGPDDWCSQPLWSVNGSFQRHQTRWFALDAGTGQYLEYTRLIHLDIADSLVAAPDADPATGVQTLLQMTWRSDFDVPGDLDSRVTRKQGIDTRFKTPDGGVFTLDVGQKSTILSDDFNFRGRWDIHLGDEATEFGKVCHAVGL